MQLTNPLKTLFNFFKLSISRYTKIDLVGEGLDSIFNFLQLSDRVATAGQPTEKQFLSVKDAGYQVVINLAPQTAENALPDEKRTVESLGMMYVHIPVKFDQPTVEDFDRFCLAMHENTQRPVFVHCAANLRVSAFFYLYRRVYEGLSDEVAQVELQKIWTPNQVWQTFINQRIEADNGGQTVVAGEDEG